jgi:spoIIIJ-associated protein
MSQRFEGHNLEEALTNAATALGVERYRLTYHVVLEKRGFLGGMKRVVIEAEVNESASAPVESALPRAGAGAQRAERSGGMRAEGGGRTRGGRGRGRRGERQEREDRFEIDESEVQVEVPEQGPESEVAAEARAWVEKVLGIAKFEAQVRSSENEEEIALKIYGRDSRRLTDNNGEVLDALQVLANKALVGRKTEKDIEIDCAAFKERRVEELGEKARATADRVRRDGREQLLPAMSPIERRIVHLALQDDRDVTTESRGDGFYKRVAIIKRPAEQSSES